MLGGNRLYESGHDVKLSFCESNGACRGDATVILPNVDTDRAGMIDEGLSGEQL